MDGLQPLLTIAQAARRLNISVKLMRQLVWAGQIDYIDTNRSGRYIKARFTETHLAEYLERNEIRAG